MLFGLLNPYNLSSIIDGFHALHQLYLFEFSQFSKTPISKNIIFWIGLFFSNVLMVETIFHDMILELKNN